MKRTAIVILLLCLTVSQALAQKHEVRRPGQVAVNTDKAKTTLKKGATTAKYSTQPISNLTIIVRGVSFVMKGVQGGTFTMGRTRDQGTIPIDVWNEGTHRVVLSSFRIGQTEVTQQLSQVYADHPQGPSRSNYMIERGGATGHTSLDVLRVSDRNFFSYNETHSNDRGFRFAL